MTARGQSRSFTYDEDIAAIDELHRRDVEATKSSQFATLKFLMDEQCIVSPPDSEPVPGQNYLDRVITTAQDMKSHETILELEQNWDELKLFGDFAYERGVVHYAICDPNGKVIKETQQLMRILRRQRDGSWRVYRAMWHNPRADTEE